VGKTWESGLQLRSSHPSRMPIEKCAISRMKQWSDIMVYRESGLLSSRIVIIIIRSPHLVFSSPAETVGIRSPPPFKSNPPIALLSDVLRSKTRNRPPLPSSDGHLPELRLSQPRVIPQLPLWALKGRFDDMPNPL
jgi:hypothetical protein